MAEMFKCKTCDMPLEALAAKSKNGLVECPACSNVWTIPRKETSPAALSFLRMGEHDLDTGKFDDALEAYKKAAQLDPKEPEAHFGCALSLFRIQYLKVEPERKGDKPSLQPICHQVTRTKFTENKNYLRALELATSKQKEEYARRGKEIDYILSEFSRLEKSGVDYDCFLCVKVSGDNGKTEDSKDADYIYDLLKRKGYKPFYSERVFRNTTGGDYEASILYALVKSECMLVICRDEEFLHTPWVKNEYTRFLKLVNDEEKESDSIALVFYEAPIERLPGRNGRLQGIDFSRRDADEKLLNFVEVHTPAARAKREAEAKRQKEADAQRAIKERELDETQRRLIAALEERDRKDREREEENERLRADMERTYQEAARGIHATVGSQLTRAWQEIDARDFKMAANYFNTVLNAQPENEEAWRGLFLTELQVPDEKVLMRTMTLDGAKKVLQSKNLKNYLRYKTSHEFDALYTQIIERAEEVLSTEIKRSETEIASQRSSMDVDKGEIKRIKTLRILLPILIFIAAAVIPSIGGYQDYGFLAIPICVAISLAISIALYVKVFSKFQQEELDALEKTVEDKKSKVANEEYVKNTNGSIKAHGKSLLQQIKKQ